MIYVTSNGGVSGCHGDSGSPFFTLAPGTGGAKVIARGMDTAGTGTEFWYPNITNGLLCAHDEAFNNLTNSLTHFGATLVTGS